MFSYPKQYATSHSIHHSSGSGKINLFFTLTPLGNFVPLTKGDLENSSIITVVRKFPWKPKPALHFRWMWEMILPSAVESDFSKIAHSLFYETLSVSSITLIRFPAPISHNLGKSSFCPTPWRAVVLWMAEERRLSPALHADIPIPLLQKALHLPVILFNNLSWKTTTAWASLIWLVGLNFDICSLSKSLPSHLNKGPFPFFFLFISIFKFYSPRQIQKNSLVQQLFLSVPH